MAARSSKLEQFIEGVVAAFVARLWVVPVTGFFMHAKPEKIYDKVLDPRAAKFKVCVDGLRFYLGVGLVAGTICNHLLLFICSDMHDAGV